MSSILATQRQGLLQLFSLGLVGHDQSVKVPAAPGNAGENGWIKVHAGHASFQNDDSTLDWFVVFAFVLIWYVWIIVIDCLLTLQHCWFASAFFLHLTKIYSKQSCSQCHRDAWSWTWSALRSSWSSPWNPGTERQEAAHKGSIFIYRIYRVMFYITSKLISLVWKVILYLPGTFHIWSSIYFKL